MKRRVKRKKISVVALDAPPDDIAYWHAQTPQARLRHLQYLRELNYGKAAATGPIKRVLEIAERETAASNQSKGEHLEDA